MAVISTNVLVLGIMSLLTDMSSEMIYPILPLFLTGIGAAFLTLVVIVLFIREKEGAHFS